MSAPALIAASHTSQSLTTSITPQGAALLKITPEQLRKGGFDSMPWINYLKNVVLPQCIDMKMAFIQTIEDPEVSKHEKENLAGAQARLGELAAKLKEIKFAVKDWKKADEILIQCVYMNALMISGFDSAFKKDIEITRVVRHLQHLLLEKISLNPEANPDAGFAFIILWEKALLKLGAIRHAGAWQTIPLPIDQTATLKSLSWKTPNAFLPRHAVLFKENERIKPPFISVTVEPHLMDPVVNLKINNRLSLNREEAEKLTYVVDVTYCIGSDVDENTGNAVHFRVESHGAQCGNFPINDDRILQLAEYARSATQIIIHEWLNSKENFTFIELFFSKTFTLPTSEEELDERLLRVLELALESPEENGYLIEFIAQEKNFAFELEEIAEAQQLAAEAQLHSEEQKEVEDVTLSAKAMAYALIRKFRKKNKAAAQQPKVREIQSAKTASSFKPPVMSKEEAKALLKKSAMPADLKEQSLGLLDGERLKNKREEDKFFFDILAHQARASGSSVQKASSNGSHHSYKLVKQTDEGGKVTFRAATLVNGHGADANRGHSLSAQQSKLRQLLTPMSK